MSKVRWSPGIVAWGRLALLLLLGGQAQAGSFIGSDVIGVDLVVHPSGYTGTGGTLSVTVCIDPTSANAAAMVTPVQNVIQTWNALIAVSPNLLFGGDNNIPATDVDFESTALHELGHCIGLGHPNLSTESGLSDPDRNYTKTTQGADLAYDLDDGADDVIGSSDDVRDDDVNLHWFRKSNNNPFTLAGTVDASTYSRDVADLPLGHLFVANADRDVGALLGFADTEAVMQQGAFFDEDQRQLNHDDVGTFRLGMSGLDETASTSDDYTVTLSYGGMTTGCDVDIDFDDSQASFAACLASLTQISGDHWRISGANMYFNTGFSWFFNTVGSTTTTTPPTTSTSTSSTSSTSTSSTSSTSTSTTSSTSTSSSSSTSTSSTSTSTPPTTTTTSTLPSGGDRLISGKIVLVNTPSNPASNLAKFV
jgi:hypothetical protein